VPSGMSGVKAMRDVAYEFGEIWPCTKLIKPRISNDNLEICIVGGQPVYFRWLLLLFWFTSAVVLLVVAC